MLLDDCYFVGTIGKAHGISGEVKVLLDVDDLEEYTEMESVYVLLGNKLTPFFIENIRVNGPQHLLVKFKDIFDREGAEAIAHCQLYLPLDQLPELEPGQFYYHDVIGYTVSDKQLGLLGEVMYFQEMPQNDLLVMQYKDKEVLIPVNWDVVLEADHDNKLVLTNLPDGLLEIYL